MSDHSEVIEEARKLFEKLRYGTIVTSPTEAEAIRALADIVEEQDKQQPAFDKLLTACRTCGEAIAAILNAVEGFKLDGLMLESRTRLRTELRAAGYLAKRAVELGDKAKGGA